MEARERIVGCRVARALKAVAAAAVAAVGVAALVAAGASHARAQGEAYYFATGGMNGGPSDYVDRWCGPDMLPYTADDIDLPERGNSGGTWGFAWIDSDGDGLLAEDERIFVVIRRGDDDLHSFSTRSYPQYGVIAESEDWIDYHEARNRGPSGAELGDPSTEGNDFEHNDRAGPGEAGWEDASNYYWYNSAAADQRGWGGSRYYFEHRNGARLDEIEGFSKWLSFQNNADDPRTALNERGDCRNSYMRSLDAVTKGLLIPVEDIGTLEDGELDTLFGWYQGDMAEYVRDVLGPRLDEDELTVFSGEAGCSRSGLPPTHLMILQIECPIRINGSGDCASQATAEALAAYWGIQPVAPGEPETDAVYRVSHILLLNDELTAVELGVPNLVVEPLDGVARNLWVQDDFWRADRARVGRYELGGTWTIEDDTSFDRGCSEMDTRLELPGGPPGFFEAPLPEALDPGKGDVYAVAEVGELDDPEVDPPVEMAVYQLILLDGEDVVAWAEFGVEGSSVGVGGTLDGDGLASSPARSATGAAAAIPILDPADTRFPRLVLRAGPAGVTLLEADPEEYVANDYEFLDEYVEIASLSPGVTEAPGVAAGGVTAVRFAVRNGSTSVTTAVDGFAVFSNLVPSAPPAAGLFIRGDTNDDGGVDISDGIFLLNHLFLGGPRWVCEEGADINSDGAQDLSDAVYAFGFLFLGGPEPLAPFPACGPDPGGKTCPESSCNAG